MKEYGFNVSPYIVPLLVWIGGVALKWLPWREVMDFVYMLLSSSLASLG